MVSMGKQKAARAGRGDMRDETNRYRKKEPSRKRSRDGILKELGDIKSEKFIIPQFPIDCGQYGDYDEDAACYEQTEKR
jgi:hypothetical protein